MTQHVFGVTPHAASGGYYGHTYTVNIPPVVKDEPKQNDEHATVWDLPGWKTAFTVKGMLEKDGLVGWTSQNPGSRNLVADADGKLYILAEASLTPRNIAAPAYGVEVVSHQGVKDGPVRLTVNVGGHVPSYIHRVNKITDTGYGDRYLPVAQVGSTADRKDYLL